MKFVIGMKALSLSDIWVYDLEIFPNFFLLSARNGDKRYQTSSINGAYNWIMNNRNELILGGFNNAEYDDIILKYIYTNPDCEEIDLYNLSMSIIKELNQDVVRHYKWMEVPWKFSIDLYKMLNMKGGLKEWMAKYGLPKLMEAGYSFEEPLPIEGQKRVCEYCDNDVEGCYLLLERFWHLVDLRTTLIKEMNLNNVLYILSEAQVAQNVLMTMYEREGGEPQKYVRAKARKNPDNRTRKIDPCDIVFACVDYETASFKALLAKVMASNFLGSPTGTSWSFSDTDFKKKIKVGSRYYKIGVGGIHSDDGPGRYESTKTHVVIDLDVESYYPAIMINNRLHPRHMGESFIDIYTKLRDMRVEAKHAQKDAKAKGDEHSEKKYKGINEALKIVINSTFGKLNDMYSPFRSILDALRVTINGQLCILMLVEKLEKIGAKIISANTDGVTIYISRKSMDDLSKIVKWWEGTTTYKLEQVSYVKFWQRDVNNYMALKEDNTVKGKGEFAIDDPKTKLEALAIVRAAHSVFNSDGRIKIKNSFLSETEVNGFLFYQKVKNGGKLLLGGRRIGTIARWYVAKEGELLYRKNPDNRKQKGAKIPRGDNAVLIMDTTGLTVKKLLQKIDIEYYIGEVNNLLESTRE